MTGSRRDRFLQRISTVGGGTREAIQMLLGGVVLDVRDLVERGIFTEEEMDVVVPFHDQIEEFWRHTMESNPPMEPLLMVTGLRRLRDGCVGPVAGFHPRLDQALEKATTFANAGKHARN